MGLSDSCPAEIAIGMGDVKHHPAAVPALRPDAPPIEHGHRMLRFLRQAYRHRRRSGCGDRLDPVVRDSTLSEYS